MDERKQRLGLTPRRAKSLLRVKRGWGSFRRKINPVERHEERKENAERGSEAVRRERAREARAYQDRQNRSVL